jgi:hypothetical protein
VSPRETRSDGFVVSRLAFEQFCPDSIRRFRCITTCIRASSTLPTELPAPHLSPLSETQTIYPIFLWFRAPKTAATLPLDPPSSLPRTHHMPPPPSRRRLSARQPPRPRRVPPPPQRSRAQRPTPSQNGQEDPPHATTTLPLPPPQSPPSTPPRKVGYLHPPTTTPLLQNRTEPKIGQR